MHFFQSAQQRTQHQDKVGPESGATNARNKKNYLWIYKKKEKRYHIIQIFPALLCLVVLTLSGYSLPHTCSAGKSVKAKEEKKETLSTEEKTGVCPRVESSYVVFAPHRIPSLP